MCIVADTSRQEEVTGLKLTFNFGPMRGAGGTMRPVNQPIVATTNVRIAAASTGIQPATTVPVRIDK